MTWNRVFGFLGLRMMQEARENQLKNDLETVVEAEHYDNMTRLLESEVKKSARKVNVRNPEIQCKGISIADEDFQTVFLQFDALGLIQHSKRNRSIGARRTTGL